MDLGTWRSARPVTDNRGVSARARFSILLWAIGVVAAVGMLEAWRIGAAGLFGLVAVIELLAIGTLVSLRSRAPVVVRGDLAAWLDTTSAITGETASALANRALSSYRAALSDDRRD